MSTRTTQLTWAHALTLAHGAHIQTVTYSVPHLDRSQPQSSPPLTSARPAGVARLGGVRMHLATLERERREQIRMLRELRDHADDPGWGRLQGQFTAAQHGKAFSDTAHAGRTITKASW